MLVYLLFDFVYQLLETGSHRHVREEQQDTDQPRQTRHVNCEARYDYHAEHVLQGKTNFRRVNQ